MALRTGYAKYYGFSNNYLKDWPAVNENGDRWIVERGVKVLGCNSIGIESFYSADVGNVHHSILGTGICIVEELNLEDIADYGEKRWFFCWLPVLIKGAGGSFVRAVAKDFE